MMFLVAIRGTAQILPLLRNSIENIRIPKHPGEEQGKADVGAEHRDEPPDDGEAGEGLHVTVGFVHGRPDELEVLQDVPGGIRNDKSGGHGHEQRRTVDTPPDETSLGARLVPNKGRDAPQHHRINDQTEIMRRIS